MATVKNVGEPCAGEPHARIDGGREETKPVGLTQPRGPGASCLPDQRRVQACVGQPRAGMTGLSRRSSWRLAPRSCYATAVQKRCAVPQALSFRASRRSPPPRSMDRCSPQERKCRDGHSDVLRQPLQNERRVAPRRLRRAEPAAQGRHRNGSEWLTVGTAALLTLSIESRRRLFINVPPVVLRPTGLEACCRPNRSWRAARIPRSGPTRRRPVGNNGTKSHDKP
jgi:hypothetical protein